MMISYHKYHALGNDFLVLEQSRIKSTAPKCRKLVQAICHRQLGIGADGVLFVSRPKEVSSQVDVYNADGSWAEKSGNGLRIIAAYLSRLDRKKKQFFVRMGGAVSNVTIRSQSQGNYQVKAELGRPDFVAARVPVRTKGKYLVNSKVKIGGKSIDVTCLAIGNPHTVLFVDDFNFNWQEAGRQIEHAPIFPHGTNVEFARVVTRKKLKVNDWERGAGATASSGTGAAAAVCAGVMLGRVERVCEVQFESGSLSVEWREKDDAVELTGPVAYVGSGEFYWPGDSR